MKKLFYISGPITDNATGQPREGWEKDFQDAKDELERMGFETISPVEMTEAIEEDFQKTRKCFDECADAPQSVPRWFYIGQCLLSMCIMTAATVFGKHEKVKNPLSGVYVIGNLSDIQQSYGTMCEINFALSADLPVFSQYHHGYQIDNLLRPVTKKPTLEEVASIPIKED